MMNTDNEKCMKCMKCKKCSDNFNKFSDDLLDYINSDINNLINLYTRYEMRNNSKKFTKILQSLMNINKYSKCDKFQIPNKHMSISQEEINNRLVNKIIISSEPKKFKLQDILCTLYCPQCWDELKFIDREKVNTISRDYFGSTNITKIFNFIIINPEIIFNIDESKKKTDKFVNTINNKLKEFCRQENKFYNDKWKGSNYYFKEIFGIPMYLEGIVTREHYQKFHNNYITDIIAGHPMASNGWYKESLLELEEMGVFEN